MAKKWFGRRDFFKAVAAASAMTIGSGLAGCTGIVSSAGSDPGSGEDETPSVERSAMIAVRDLMGAKAGERVLIVTDTLRKDLGKPIYEAAQKLGCDTTYLEMELRTRSGEEPSAGAAKSMQETDVAILTTKYSLTHTDATRNACAAGARVGSMPIQSEDVELVRNVFATGGMTADPDQISAIAKKLRGKINNATEIRITTELGTDITFKVTKGFWISEMGVARSKGSLANLPGGEVLTVPCDTSGVIFIDGSFGDYGLLKSPLELTIENGICTGAKGDHADDLNGLFADLGSEARKVGEFGIGINPAAKLSGIILEDEKAIGTVHMALGDNLDFGGDVHVPIHFDGIVTKPRVEVDGKAIDINLG